MGGKAEDSNYSEGGQFDVAYHVDESRQLQMADIKEGSGGGGIGGGAGGSRVPELARIGSIESRNDASDVVTDQFDYEANPADGGRLERSPVDADLMRPKERYRFPGSEMTRELYERRGVDLNNNA